MDWVPVFHSDLMSLIDMWAYPHIHVSVCIWFSMFCLPSFHRRCVIFVSELVLIHVTHEAWWNRWKLTLLLQHSFMLHLGKWYTKTHLFHHILLLSSSSFRLEWMLWSKKISAHTPHEKEPSLFYAHTESSGVFVQKHILKEENCVESKIEYILQKMVVAAFLF